MLCARKDVESFCADDREAILARYEEFYFGTRTANGTFDCVLRAVMSKRRRVAQLRNPRSWNWLLLRCGTWLPEEGWQMVAMCPPCVEAQGEAARQGLIVQMEADFMRRYSSACWTQMILITAGVRNLRGAYLFEDVAWISLS